MDRRFNVLVAEDNPGDVFLIRRALDRQGLNYDLIVAKDGEEAMQAVGEAAQGEHLLDLLLIDLNLPRHDGATVLAAARHQEALKDVPVVVLTSSDSPQDRVRCLELGANRYFQKPSTLTAFMKLGEVVEELLAGK